MVEYEDGQDDTRQSSEDLPCRSSSLASRGKRLSQPTLCATTYQVNGMQSAASLYASNSSTSTAKKRLSRRSAVKKPLLNNRVNPAIEQAVVVFAIVQPTSGQHRVSNELRKQGIVVSGRVCARSGEAFTEMRRLSDWRPREHKRGWSAPKNSCAPLLGLTRSRSTLSVAMRARARGQLAVTARLSPSQIATGSGADETHRAASVVDSFVAAACVDESQAVASAFSSDALGSAVLPPFFFCRALAYHDCKLESTPRSQG